MFRRTFLKSAVGAASASFAANGKPPNIVLILADDLGYGDLGCYGNDSAPTPNLDRMAGDGVRFTDFHSNGAVCSPTRCALVTGRYQQRAGIHGVITAASHRDTGLEPGEPSFAEQLRKAGYRTAVFGKWHLGYDPRYGPNKHGFDEFRGFVSGNVDYQSHVDQAGYEDWWHNDKLVPEQGYTTELITRHSLRFIEENRARPFCLYMAHEAVHSPWQGPRDPAFRKAGKTTPEKRDPEYVRTRYRQMLAALDESVGRVLERLATEGLDRETFVFFTSDNGAIPAGSNGPLRGHKASVWEGGHRVAAIARWPGRIKGGRTSEVTALTMDLFPTFLELSGAARPEKALDGVGLLAHLESGKPLAARPLFWAHGEQRAVRDGEWKLVRLSRGQPPQLFRLSDDIGEQRDLSKAEPMKVARLSEMLDKWQRETFAPLRA